MSQALSLVRLPENNEVASQSWRMEMEGSRDVALVSDAEHQSDQPPGQVDALRSYASRIGNGSRHDRLPLDGVIDA